MAPKKHPGRLNELTTIPSSMDPISSGSTIPPSSRSLSDGATLRRTRSMNIDDTHSDGEGDEMTGVVDVANERDRHVSPIHANMRRRRAVSSASGYDMNSPLVCDQERATDKKARSHLIIQIIHLSIVKAHGFQPNRLKLSVKEVHHAVELDSDRRHLPKLRPPSTGLPQHGDENSGGSQKPIAYETKGAYRLQKNRGIEKFLVPKPLAPQKPTWRAGDGFSGDEARPDFMFLMTGKHKRRRSRSPPGMNKLELEKEAGSMGNLRGSGTIRPKLDRFTRVQMKHLRGEAKDTWPTIDNFSDDSAVRARNPAVPASQIIIPSTIPPQPTPIPIARELLNPVRSSPKGARLNFEDFGQQVRRIMSSSQEDRVPRDAPTHFRGPEPRDEGEEEYSMEEDDLVSERYNRQSDDEEQGHEEECDDYSDSMPDTSAGDESSVSGHNSRSRGSTTSVVCDQDPQHGQCCGCMQLNCECSQRAPMSAQVESLEH
ncbi:hypothetical protein F5B20DRAFT_588241 [Whalleya microplaca]|nr:hypothetical protein F5B20DRAFT_588241 [Whalleya microplaca]